MEINKDKLKAVLKWDKNNNHIFESVKESKLKVWRETKKSITLILDNTFYYDFYFNDQGLISLMEWGDGFGWNLKKGCFEYDYQKEEIIYNCDKCKEGVK